MRNVANADMSLWVASTEPYGGQSDGQPDFVCDSMFLVKLAALRCYKSQFRILHTNSKRAKFRSYPGKGTQFQIWRRTGVLPNRPARLIRTGGKDLVFGPLFSSSRGLVHA